MHFFPLLPTQHFFFFLAMDLLCLVGEGVVTRWTHKGKAIADLSRDDLISKLNHRPGSLEQEGKND